MYFDMLVSNENNPEQISWISNLKQLLFELGFGYAWLNQGVQCETSFISQIKQRLHDVYIQQWNTEIMATSSSRMFKHIKSTFKFENYLHISNQSFRKALTKVRLSSHSFFIERGRWAKIKLKSKIELGHTAIS